MQIKLLRFFIGLIICYVCNATVAFAACKSVDSVDGKQILLEDLKENKEFNKTHLQSFGWVCSESKGGRCIKLTDIELQSYAQAVQIAKNYALERFDKKIICASIFYTACGDRDDHILCVDSQKNKYEFIFDDIMETRDERYKKGIGTAFCKIYMGDDSEIDKHSQVEYKQSTFGIRNDATDVTHSYNDYLDCAVGQTLEAKSKQQYDRNPGTPKEPNYPDDLIYEQAVKLNNKLSENFPYTAKYKNYNVVLDFHTLEMCPTDNIVTRFKTQQINLDQNVTAWLGMYWAREHSFKKFKCDLSPQTCQSGVSGVFKKPNDDILTCYADGVAVRFLFDDLSESGKRNNASASSMMQCMTTNGEFDGSHCRGLDQTQCAELGEKVPGGTQWDLNLDTCVLNSSAKLEDRNRALEVLKAVGGAVALVAVTVVTGGTATAVFLAVATTATTSISEMAKGFQYDKVQRYLSDLDKCNEKECARNLLNQYFTEISYYNKAITPDMAMGLDDILSRKLDLFDSTDQKVFEEMLNRADRSLYDRWKDPANIPATQVVKDVADVLTVALSFIPLKGAATALAGGKLKTIFGSINLTKTQGKIVKILETTRKMVTSKGASGVNAITSLSNM